jgi:hypothetical protein
LTISKIPPNSAFKRFAILENMNSGKEEEINEVDVSRDV